VIALARRPRTLCLLALAAGVTLGGLTHDTAAPPRMTAGGFTVLAGDFHVHGSPDGIPPWDAVREARRRRLDVIALTSHNSLRGWRLWQHSPVHEDEVMVLPGEELTSVGYHMAIVGLERPIAWHQRVAAAAAAAHAQQAVAILAHPSDDQIGEFITDEDLLAVDGIEVAHPGQDPWSRLRRKTDDTYRRASALKPVAAIGSSDFHYLAPIGSCRTYLFVREATPAGVLEAIRAARTVACDTRGEATGPRALADIVAARCRADALAPPRDADVLSRAGVLLSWAALAALIVLGAPAGT
jgi:hypothetical protein